MRTATHFIRATAALAAVVASATLGSPAAAATPSGAFQVNAMTSSFVAYSGTSFSGRSIDINGCGPHNIAYHGSYKWYGRGQSGRMYNLPNVQGVAHTVLPTNRYREQDTSFGWQSIFIVC